MSRVSWVEFLILYIEEALVGCYGSWAGLKIQIGLNCFGRFNVVTGWAKIDESHRNSAHSVRIPELCGAPH